MVTVQWTCVGGLATLLLACGSTSDNLQAVAGAAGSAGAGVSQTGGAAGASAGNAAGGANSAAGASGSGAGAGESCASATPERLEQNGGVVRLPLAFVSMGRPVVGGAPAAADDGLAYTPYAFKLFLSNPKLTRADGSPAVAQFLDGNGQPVAHAVALVEMDVTRELVLAAPAGAYTDLTLSLGLSAACNGMDPTRSVSPMNADSEMYWGWGAKYIFLKVEGNMTMGLETGPFAYHFGAESAPEPASVRMSAELYVDGRAGTGPQLVIDLGKLMAPAPGLTLSERGHLVDGRWAFQNLTSNGVLSLKP